MAEIKATLPVAAAQQEQEGGEDEAAAKDVAGTRRQQKQANKLQKRLAADFCAATEGIQRQHEDMIQQGGAGCQLAKERRKALKAVLKVVADSSLPLEERMRLLSDRFAAVLQDQLAQDKAITDLQEQLQASRKEVDAGKAEAARSQQKVDSLQKLARGLSAEHKLLAEDASRQKQHTDNVQGLLKSIQERIDEQQQETHKVLEHNKLLAQENGLLKSQLGSTQEALEQLRTTQQDRISALAEQLQQQNEAMGQASKLHQALDALMKENEALTLKAALADTMKERNEALEKAFTEAQAQAASHMQQMAEMQDSLKKATKVLQGFDKLQKSMTDQQQVTTQLMQERQLLQQQVQLLTQQSRDQADKLRRTQLQKQRLEGLCRTLQARSGGDASSLTAEGLVGGAGCQPSGQDAAAAPGVGADSEAAVAPVGVKASEGPPADTAASSDSNTAADVAADLSREQQEAAAATGGPGDIVQQVLDNILQSEAT